eukprot:m.76367 g.76367  ORF g.76367 m.76367 type:complete len:1027 (+) comp8513_c0_seq1:118-3198(+)
MDGSGVVTTSGGVYDGSLVDGVPEGFGVIKWPQRPRSAASYRGEMKHGVRTGKGGLDTLPGTHYEGSFEKNMRHGYGVQSIKHDSSVVEGIFVNGQLEGQGRWKFDKYLEYEGEFHAGVIHGKGRMVFVDGTVYEGDFFNGVRHGKGKSVWPDGDTYEGNYENDKRQGHGCYIWVSGQKYVGEFLQGKRHGLGTVTWPNKSRFVGYFQDGKRDGYGLLLHHDHSLDSGIWKGPMLIRLMSCHKTCDVVQRPELYEKYKDLYPGKMSKIAIHAMKCAFNGDTLQVVRLVERNGICPDMCTSGGVSLLMLAASQGHIETVSGLLDVGASVDWQTDTNMTTLNLSYQLVNGLDFDKLPLREISAQILSDSALLHSNYEDEFDDSVSTVSFCSNKQKMLDTYHLLLARGANANISIFPTPIIISAVQLHDFDVLQLLLLHGASPDQIDENDPLKRSPLIFAANALIQAEGDEHVVNRVIPIFKLLVEGRCDVNLADDNGWTVLHTLALVHSKAAIDLIPLLIEKGANVNLLTKEGCSPLAHAIKSGNAESARMLLMYGADPDVKLGKNQETTCLNLVFTSHPSRVDSYIRLELVDLLLEFNSNPIIPVKMLPDLTSTASAIDCFHYVLQHENEFISSNRQSRKLSNRFQQLSTDDQIPLPPSSVSSPHRRSSSRQSSRRLSHNTESSLLQQNSQKNRRQTYAFLPGQGTDDQPPTEEDLEIAELVTTAVRKAILKESKLDHSCCFQCGRSFNQHLTTFSGSKLIYFCGGRCKMRALNGPNRRQILHSLRRTNPTQWRLLQQQDDSQVVWKGENVDMFDKRSATAPPDFAFEEIAHRKHKDNLQEPEISLDSSRINVTPLPSLSEREVRRSAKEGESLKGRLGFLPRLSTRLQERHVAHSLSTSEVVQAHFTGGRASRPVEKTTFKRPFTTGMMKTDLLPLYTSVVDTSVVDNDGNEGEFSHSFDGDESWSTPSHNQQIQQQRQQRQQPSRQFWRPQYPMSRSLSASPSPSTLKQQKGDVSLSKSVVFSLH